MSIRSLILALGCSLALTASFDVSRGTAQESDSPSLTITQLDWSAYPEMTAVVQVLDPLGVPEPGLGPAQFQAFDGQSQIEVLDAAPAQDQMQPLDVVLTIDVSGSMQGAPIAAARAAATDFVNGLGPQDRAAVVAFSDEVTPVLGLTNDKTALTNAIAGLDAVGATALFEAVQVSTFLAGATAAEGNRAAVIFLSDGENEAPDSSATAQTSIDIAQGSGIPVYPIGFGALTDVPYLQQLAQVTQGQYREATTGTVAEVYGEVSTLLRSQYIVRLRAEAPIDGSAGTLQLVAQVGGTPAASVANFQRGVLASFPPGDPASNPSSAGSDSGGSGVGDFALYGLGAMVAMAALAVGAVALVRFQRHRAMLAHQMSVVAPNPALAAAQGVPRRTGSYVASEAIAAQAAEVGTGQLVERGGEERVIDIGAGPIILGTSAVLCQVVLHDGAQIAPEHARIWMRGKRYVLHHTGGMSRKTYVANHEADWVVLDPGDEIAIGRYRFIFEDGTEYDRA